MFDIDTWANGYKVRSFPWIDGKHIYFNVQEFTPGGRIDNPIMDKSVLIVDDDNAQTALTYYLWSLTAAIAQMKNASIKTVITVSEIFNVNSLYKRN